VELDASCYDKFPRGVQDGMRQPGASRLPRLAFQIDRRFCSWTSPFAALDAVTRTSCRICPWIFGRRRSKQRKTIFFVTP